MPPFVVLKPHRDNEPPPSFVILNLFQDNAMPCLVILKQVQNDEGLGQDDEVY